ncbi:MAG: hypothetical protein ACI4RA_07170 [Kiritimatiellia bacterium]
MKKLMTGLAGVMAMAATAASFSYQGVLRDATGAALAEKNQMITFRLYDGPTTETALWGRSSSVLLDEDGLFTVELGDATGSEVEGLTNTLDKVIAENAAGALYIGLEVKDSSGEIRPRQKVLAVPLASYAQDVGTAKGDFTVKGKATVSGALEVTGDAAVGGTAEVNKLSVKNGGTLAGSVNVTGPLNLSSGRLEMPASSTFTIGGVSAVIPAGVIVMWSGNTGNIPQGWVLCDGRNGAPDLRNRFIVGAGDKYSPKATGGRDTVVLTVEQMPSHTHTFFGDDQLTVGAERDHTEYGYDAESRKSHNYDSGHYKTSAAGNGREHENRPPYYALCFIMKK